MGGPRRSIYILAIAAIAAAAYSCNSSGCLENRSSLPLAGMYSSASGKAISIDSLVITGIGRAGGVELTDGSEPVSSVYLPMRSTEQTTAWSLMVKAHYIIDDHVYYTSLNDTISFGYTSEPYFASDECGVIYKYHITDMRYTTHAIDSVVITDSLITNIDTERIKIYYRTDS